MIRAKNEQNVIPYEQSMGAYDYPDELLSVIRGLPIGEQARYLCVQVTEYYNDDKREYCTDLIEALGFAGVVVDNGLIVGLYRKEKGYAFFGQDLNVYYSEENNGAGYKTLDSYEMLTYSLSGEYAPYYSQFVIDESVVDIEPRMIPPAERYVMGPNVQHIATDAFPNEKPIYYVGDLSSWFEAKGREELNNDIIFCNEDLEPIEQLTLPTNIEVIREKELSHIRKLKRLIITSRLKKVCQDAFYDSDYFEVYYYGTVESWLELEGRNYIYSHNIYLHDTDGNLISDVCLPDSMTAVPEYAFVGCKSIKNVTIPQGVKTIRRNAFYHSGIQSVVLPYGLEEICHEAFSGCDSLTSLALPDTLRLIGDSAFSNCHSLTSLVLPDTLRLIGDDAFYGAGLTTLDIPAAVNEIGSMCFKYSKITSVHFHSLPQSVGDFSYYTPPKELRVFFHVDIEEWLQPCAGREHLMKFHLVLPFLQNTNGVLTLPEGVREIDAFAFSGLREIKKVICSSTTEVLGQSAFSNCPNLTSVDLRGVKTIAMSAFSNCPNLCEVNLYEGLTSIDGYAFRECKSLRAIRIPATVATMGSYVFLNCIRKLAVTCAVPSAPAGWSDKWNAKDYFDEKLENVTFGA